MSLDMNVGKRPKDCIWQAVISPDIRSSWSSTVCQARPWYNNSGHFFAANAHQNQSGPDINIVLFFMRRPARCRLKSLLLGTTNMIKSVTLERVHLAWCNWHEIGILWSLIKLHSVVDTKAHFRLGQASAIIIHTIVDIIMDKHAILFYLRLNRKPCRQVFLRCFASYLWHLERRPGLQCLKRIASIMSWQQELFICRQTGEKVAIKFLPRGPDHVTKHVARSESFERIRIPPVCQGINW